MSKLKIILQYNKVFTILLGLSLIFAFIKIFIIKYHSVINTSENFTGIITNIKYDEGIYKLNIKDKEEIICYYKSKTELDINLGDTIVVSGEFYEPSNNTAPNNFNYKRYLNNNKIYYLMNAKTLKIIKKNTHLNYKVKSFILNRAEKSLTKTKGYIKAFIIGDKTDLETYSYYQDNGVSHLFALSGMHISLLTAIIYFLLRKNKRQDLITISFLIFYLTITNYSASLIRSIIFFILLKINKKYDLNISTKNILLLTITLLIFYNPLIIFNYGFLYSVVVTYGLIISSKYYRKNYFINLILTSLIAFFFSLPITASLNYEINITSIINNLVIVPLISIIIYPLSLITFIFPFIEPLLTFMIFILEKINSFLGLLSINIIIPKVSIIVYFIYYIFLIIFIKSNNFKYLIICLLLILSIRIKPLLNNDINIYFLDVKQGDSTLITKNKEVVLIDTGGIRNYNVSDNTIKLIKSLGYGHINLMILTHGH